MAAERKPTFFQSLAAGGLAGTAVDLLFFPIDTVKTRLQSAQGFVKAGGFRGIYKGVGSVVVGSAPGAAAFFSTYEAMKHSIPLHGQLAPVNHMLSAPGRKTSMYGASTSSFKAATLVLQHDGIRGFYRGFWTTIMREIPFTSLQFPLYEFLKHRLSIYLDRKPLYAHEAAVCGSIAGGTAAALTTPLDVLKTRVMLDLRDPSKQQVPSLPARFRQIYVQEGAKVLFAGIVPRTMWISAGGAVFLGVYEWAVHGFMST
ncbi:mitochondrial carrier domain-containing protein [Suillus clintonianus]|uniref:mitochondrial carrier domain-containing protein n=1 Tax=Suillus clintonianus TaxID=1904413 RepID=UPI001B878368|nr:mitochondrial carrier domain-containing protein [Suillus clintonianus]KAG2123799.1 mitochondrial carrier domain-containing protein [Suillus clintonianus]